MVNYFDPVTMAREYSTYAFLPGFGGLQLDLLIGPFNSGDGEAMARRGWYIYVSLHLPRVLPRRHLGTT
jgi:hypothetical protein